MSDPHLLDKLNPHPNMNLKIETHTPNARIPGARGSFLSKCYLWEALGSWKRAEFASERKFSHIQNNLGPLIWPRAARISMPRLTEQNCSLADLQIKWPHQLLAIVPAHTFYRQPHCLHLSLPGPVCFLHNKTPKSLPPYDHLWSTPKISESFFILHPVIIQISKCN